MRQKIEPGSVGPTEYKYKGNKDTGLMPHEECEDANNGYHRVRPATWPPQRMGSETGEPVMPLNCIDCGTWVLAEEAHATGKKRGVTVILPEEPKKKTA